MKNPMLVLGLALAMLGCGDEGSSGGDGCPPGQVRCDGPCIDEIEPNLQAIQDAIFRPSCTTFTVCHTGTDPAQGLDLSSLESSSSTLIGVESVQVAGKLRVAPNDSAASYLVNKITGVDIAPNTLRMPISARPEVLCEPKIDAIRRWIDDGARAE